MFKTLLTTALVLVTTTAGADWLLDADDSSVSFASVKNAIVVEPHLFTDLSGEVETDGTVEIVVELESIDTGIPIRDERMMEMLFNTEENPEAIFETQVPIREFQEMNVGDSRTREVTGRLTLNGESVEKTVEVKVVRIAEGRVAVSSTRPMIIDAAEFNLMQGIEALREIAGLESITPMVPVSFSLFFTDDSITGHMP